MQIRTFIRTEGARAVFWEITWEGRMVEVAEGPLGTEGQARSRHFSSLEEAREFVDEQIAVHRADGYEERDTSELPVQIAAASDPDLEARLSDHPQDRELYLVYADWLSAQGDPRGELIQLQHRLLEERSHEIEVLVRSLLQNYRQHLLGDLYLYPEVVGVTWHLGFVRTVVIDAGSFTREKIRVVDLLRQFLAHPSSALVRTLRIGMLETDAEDNYNPIAEALVDAAPRPSLRYLVLSAGAPYGYGENVLKTTELWKHYPQLTRVAVHTEAHFDPATSVLPNVTSLVWTFGGIDPLMSILNGVFAPKVKHLTLAQLSDIPTHYEALMGSKILPQLETLELPTLRGNGAQVLLENPDPLAHLDELVLSERSLNRATRRALERLPTTVRFEQRDSREEEEYDHESRFVNDDELEYVHDEFLDDRYDRIDE